MEFPETLATITCRCVIERGSPVLFVSHAGGDWQMYCRAENHNFDDADAMRRELTVVHVHHLTAKDPTLGEVAGLSVDMAAEREAIGAEWHIFDDADEE